MRISDWSSDVCSSDLDGSRVNIVIPPVALDGPMVSIRKLKRQQMSAQDFVQSGAMSAEMLDFLADAVRSRLNILICGGTGSGKTTLLNMLSAFIDDSERLTTNEDNGRASCRERVCQYVYIAVGAVSLKKKKTYNTKI